MERIDSWLSGVADIVDREAPNLRPMFDVFAAEARFGRQWLAPVLASLAAGARILEVGAGLMLLSGQLAREGFEVVALEPIGEGFDDFRSLQALVLRHAQAAEVHWRVLDARAEDLQERDQYDLAFSINVMEHVGDVAATLRSVTRALKPGASYAFTCPNYRFPYEQHFALPILGSKRFTERVFGRAIRGSRRMPDPLGVWRSLNWIHVGMIDRCCAQLGDVDWRYDRAFLSRALQRVTHDAEFASRRPGWLLWLCRVAVATGLHRLGALLPAAIQPGIDCNIRRQQSSGGSRAEAGLVRG